MWVLFQVPCRRPTVAPRRTCTSAGSRGSRRRCRRSAREHGCRFHRAWYAEDGSAFYAIANWESREGAHAFFEEWEIEDEPGEVAIYLEGDVGLVPVP